MDIERALGAPFKDPKWHVKSAWAGLWTILFVTAPAVTGYSLDYIWNVAHGHETPLPEWDGGFGRYWTRGLMVWVAGFVYFLPALVLMIVGMAPLLGAAAADSASIQGARGLALLGSGTMCLTMLLATVYLMAVSVFFYAAQVNFAFSVGFGSMFRFGEIMARVRSDTGGYFTAWGMSVVFAFVAGIITSVVASVLSATVVLAVATPFVSGAVAFVSIMISSHLLGQYAARAYGLPGLPRRYDAGYAAATSSEQWPETPQSPAPPLDDTDVNR